MDYRIATAPAATVEQLGLHCEPWQSTRLVADIKTETLTAPVAGFGYFELRRRFLRHPSLESDQVLRSRLWLEDDRSLRRDQYEVSRDYCAVVQVESREVRAWLVIVQLAPNTKQPEQRKFSVTCLWLEVPIEGRERSRSLNSIEEMGRLYIDRSYVRKNRLPGIPVADGQFAPVFAETAPINFYWPQIDTVR